MVITRRFNYSYLLIWAGILLAISPADGQDKIVLKGGQTIVGKISEVVDGQVKVAVSDGMVPYPLTNIASVDAAAPVEMDKAHQSTAPSEIIALTEPIIKKYLGLPVDWVSEAISMAAEAYAEQGKDSNSVALYEQMAKIYPTSRFQVRAQAGLAKTLIRAGKYDEALAKVGPLIDEANKSFAPSAADGRVYGDAFLVQGQALEKQGKLKEALESYLTIVTVFFQNPETVKVAQEHVDKLRKNNPQVVVD